MVIAERYHDISCGHRVVGHTDDEGNPGPCSRLHGHNYRVFFRIGGKLDKIGMVLDFGLMKKKLCVWLDKNWDHRFLCWSEDPWRDALTKIDPSTVWLDFNPTAENLAQHLVEVIGPTQLEGTGANLVSCTVEETRKCSANFSLDFQSTPVVKAKSATV